MFWPPTHAASVLVGVLVALQKTSAQWRITAAIAAAHIALGYVSFQEHSVIPVIATVLALMTVSAVPVPAFLITPLSKISAASLYIYLIHLPLATVVHGAVGYQSPLQMTIIAIIVGTLGWEVWRRVLDLIGIRKISTLSFR